MSSNLTSNSTIFYNQYQIIKKIAFQIPKNNQLSEFAIKITPASFKTAEEYSQQLKV